MKNLADKTIVLGITGSIAAVRTVELAHELIRRGATVVAVMTESAQRIIHPDAVECATGMRPITDWTGRTSWVEYCCGSDADIDTGTDAGSGGKSAADLLLIAPCTAATIGKIAHGIPDTLVSIFATTAIGAGVPVVVAPAMHLAMYNPVVRANIDALRGYGVGACHRRGNRRADRPRARHNEPGVGKDGNRTRVRSVQARMRCDACPCRTPRFSRYS